MRNFIKTFVIYILTFGSTNSQYQLNPYNIFSQFGSNHQRLTPQQHASRPNNQQNFYYPNQQQSNLYYPQQQRQQYVRPSVYNRYQQNTQTGSNQAFRLSERKCDEYLKNAQSSVLVGSLSLIPNIQGIETETCDASQGLIIGGEKAKAGEFPHMAAIGYTSGLNSNVNFRCGGSLISEQFVLTAAHCRAASREKPSIVRLGDWNIKIFEPNSPEENIDIAAFISHEKYDPNNNKNDIAVIKLVRQVSFSKNIRPACLMTSPNIANIPKAIATGWGLLESFSDHSADIMQKVELPIIDQNTCRRRYEDEYTIDETQFCAGERGKDTCQGDSGGPLQIVSTKNKCVHIIIGITSFGSKFCGEEESSGVYTRVSAYIDWIEQKVWG